MIDIVSHITDNYEFCRTNNGLVLKIGLLYRSETEVEEELSELLDELKEIMSIS